MWHKRNWAMNYKKGQPVSVKDCDRCNVSLRVWKDEGRTVFVASDEVFRLLENGETKLWAIGVPKSDVSAIRPRR